MATKKYRTLTHDSLFEEVKVALQSWHKPYAAGNTLDHLVLTQVARRNGAGEGRRPTNAVLAQGLERLAEMSKQEADILRWRYQDLRPAAEVAIRLNIVIGALFKKQRAAIKKLSKILLEMETTARQDQSAHLRTRLESPTNHTIFGLDEHLQALAEQVLSPDAPWIVALEGIGGIGKTTLANALAQHLINEALVGNDTVEELAWVTARQVVFNGGGALKDVERPALTRDALIDKLLQQLMPDAARAGRTSDEAFEILRTRFKQHPHLVFIDNLETVQDAAALLSTLREWAAPTRFVLTTRHHLYAEPDVYHFQVPELSEQNALRLIRTEAETCNQPLLVNASDAELRPIYETVGGNPLALRLVVGQTLIHPLGDVLEDLRDASGATVENLYAYIYRRAWDNLDEEARRVLIMMPLVTEDGGDLEFLISMSGSERAELRQVLQQLVTRNLVDRRGDLHTYRYTIHPLTRSFLQTQVLRWQMEEPAAA